MSALASVAAAAPLAQKPALPAPVMKKIDETAHSFESMFMSQMMQFIWAGDSQADETFGGGRGEEMWRGMLTQEFGRLSSVGGSGQGLGLADSVRDQMVRLQQAQMAPLTSAPHSLQEISHDAA